MPGPSLNPTVGSRTLADGVEANPRVNRTGESAVGAAHGTWLEAVRQGNVWTISTPVAGITVTANMLTSVASANAIVGAYNYGPAQAVHILRAEIVVGSNATAVGFVWGFNVPAILSPVPVGVARSRNHKLLTVGTPTGVSAFDGSVAVSGAAATDLFRPIVAGLVNTPITVEEADDDLYIPPYGFLGIFGDILTVSSIAKAAITFEVVPL